MPPIPSARLPWIDHLRTLAISLVVNLHACVTYSHVGSWYVNSEQKPSPAASVPFIIWEALLQSFFMGLLFFISGYFAHFSLARRGSRSFVLGRFHRLGLPALFYMLVIHPFILLGLNPWHYHFGPAPAYYLKFIRTGRWLGASGPLWFVIALLVFSLVLAGWRALRPATAASSPVQAPAAGKICGFAAVLGLATFLVRLIQPLGTNVLNMQLGYFVQYIALFAAGVAAARRGWLAELASSPPARRAGWIALIGGPVALLAILALGYQGGTEAFAGGWHWPAFCLALWEQFTGIGLSLGLLALFSRKLNRDGPVLRWLADRSFAVYVLHAPVLVALTMAFRALPQQLYLLAALLTMTGLAVTYALADLARRVPGVRAIL